MITFWNEVFWQWAKYDFFGISVKKNPGSHPLGNITDRRVKLLQNRSRKDEIVASIGRDLTYFEYDMITYPRLCSTCLTGVQVSSTTKYFYYTSKFSLFWYTTNMILLNRRQWLLAPLAVAWHIVQKSIWKKIKNFIRIVAIGWVQP